jgi:hypothetical protein
MRNNSIIIDEKYEDALYDAAAKLVDNRFQVRKDRREGSTAFVILGRAAWRMNFVINEDVR